MRVHPLQSKKKSEVNNALIFDTTSTLLFPRGQSRRWHVPCGAWHNIICCATSSIYYTWKKCKTFGQPVSVSSVQFQAYCQTPLELWCRQFQPMFIRVYNYSKSVDKQCSHIRQRIGVLLEQFKAAFYLLCATNCSCQSDAIGSKCPSCCILRIFASH